MQTAFIRITLSVILVAWRSFVVVGFLPSTTPTCCGGGGSGRGSIATASIIGEPGYQLSSRSPTPSIIPIGRTVTARSIVPLNAAREDCKSCIEQELATQEGIAGKDFDERRKLLKEEIRQEKSRNVKIALGSFLSAIGLFFLQHNVITPALANPVVLLRTMESTSAPLAVALTNGRPTVVDFYAEWCENCKTMAPRMREIEEQFKNQINFVVVDGSADENYDLVNAFKVDGIPHLAMVNAKGEVETAIIGIVPKEVVVDDIKAMLADRPLPYTGFDLFEGEDHNIKGQIEMDG